MLGCRPRLLINFVFPTVGSNEAPMRGASTKCLDVYVASVQDRWRIALREVQAPIDSGSMQTEMVLQQKNRCSELEAWQNHTSEGRCF